MLGYSNGYVMGNRSPGSGPIWLEGVQCRGSETDIADCPHKSWGVHSCRHSEDVSVRCGRSPPTGEDVCKVVCMIRHHHYKPQLPGLQEVRVCEVVFVCIAEVLVSSA